MNACRSCGARVTWARSAATGKWMILDEDPVQEGNVVVRRTPDGLEAEVFSAPSVADFHHPGAPRYLDHHATCPDAGKWRKGKPAVVCFTHFYRPRDLFARPIEHILEDMTRDAIRAALGCGHDHAWRLKTGQCDITSPEEAALRRWLELQAINGNVEHVNARASATSPGTSNPVESEVCSARF